MKRFTLITKNIAMVLMLAGLTLPKLAVAEAKVGDQFGDWVYECAAIAENKTICSLSQTILSKNQNKRIVKFNLGRNQKSKALDFTAILPLGINLPTGASIVIDSGKAYSLTLKTCIQQGCIAIYTTDASFIKTLQNGQKLNISFTLAGAEAPITISGSTKGLAEGIKAANLN